MLRPLNIQHVRVQETRQVVELCNRDGHDHVYIHPDNVPGASSVQIQNGTQFTVLDDEGDSYIISHNGKRFGAKRYHCKPLVPSPSPLPLQQDAQRDQQVD